VTSTIGVNAKSMASGTSVTLRPGRWIAMGSVSVPAGASCQSVVVRWPFENDAVHR
jgi:hypothetical protein